MGTGSEKKRHGSQENSDHGDKRSRLTQEPQETEATDMEFEVLQSYRKFSEAMAEDKAKMARTGDIEIAIGKLQTVDSLFQQLAGSRNNGLFAHDARAMLNISELAQISVRNLKFDNFRSIVNLEDVINSLKKFMLKDYFEWNGISESNVRTHVISQAEDQERELTHRGDEQSETIEQMEMRKSHLKQYSGYEEFNQLNWFRLGGLFNNLSKKVNTVDHLLGPFSMQRRIRAPVLRKEQDKVGALTTAEKVTQGSLSSSEEATTPEQVIRMFKLLEMKNSNHRINLFRLIVDPHSFSKSVENLFYVSFLIKEGRVILEEDQDGFPSIRIRGGLPSEPKAREIELKKRREASENHIIFQMDMPTWRNLIEKFEIRSPFIE